MINKEQQIKKSLNLKYYGKKGWMKGQECPSCGNSDKFGIKVNQKGGAVNCQVCGYKTSLFNYLKLINRLDLINYEHNISFKQEIKTIKSNRKPTNQSKDQKSVKLPLGFKSLKNDTYLDNRGFLPEHYSQFNVGETNSVFENKLKGKKIFCFYKNGKLHSWMARSTYSKKWHDENLKKAKTGEEKLVLRYENSESEFSDIIGGFDEVNEKDSLIIVEGLFDKVSVDKKLGLKHTNSKLKCVFLFGKNLSKEQLNQILIKNIKFVYLMLDGGETSDSKKTGLMLSNKIETKVCKLPNKVDPGDATAEQLLLSIQKSQTAFDFYLNNIK